MGAAAQLRACARARVGVEWGLGGRMTRALLIGIVVLVAGASLAGAGERWNLQQPIVPDSKLQCHSPECLSLSTTVRVSDACWRTCKAHCGGVQVACTHDDWLNNCRALSDSCDLSCLKRCRSYGGPLLDITE